MRAMRSRLLAGVPALLLLASVSACGDDTAKDPGNAESTSSSGSVTTEATTAGTPAAGECDWVAEGEPARDVELPPTTPEYTSDVTAVLTTSIGKLTVTLDATKAPCTVESFVSLVEQGYYDNT